MSASRSLQWVLCLGALASIVAGCRLSTGVCAAEASGDLLPQAVAAKTIMGLTEAERSALIALAAISFALYVYRTTLQRLDVVIERLTTIDANIGHMSARMSTMQCVQQQDRERGGAK